MSQYLEQAGLFDQAIRLTPEEQKSPLKVIDRFMEDYRLHEWRYFLWTAVETCLTSDNTSFSEPAERANLLLRHGDLERLLEAVYLLRRSEKQAGPAGSAAGKDQG